MIILYNFAHSHFAISCTGLKDRSFHFGFNSRSKEMIALSPFEFQLPTIILPWLDLNHYMIGSSVAPKRIGIPSVEDGNVYGPSERAIYNWLFFGDQSFATVLPVGPMSLIDSIFHFPSRLKRLVNQRPIDTWYVPMGIGSIPVPWTVDSAHCLDMVRWMLRVAFFNRDHPENLALLGLRATPLDCSVSGTCSESSRLMPAKSSQKSNHIMRMSYWRASGPGFNTLGATALFMSTAEKLRNNVIEANHNIGNECVDGTVIEAAGVGVYAKMYGRTEAERREDLTSHPLSSPAAAGPSEAFTRPPTPLREEFQAGLHTRETEMHPIYRWELYQHWMREFVQLHGDTPRHPPAYIKLTADLFRNSSSYLKDYFRNRYPVRLKSGAFYEFYGDQYMHGTRERGDWAESIDHLTQRGSFTKKGSLTTRIASFSVAPTINLPEIGPFRLFLTSLVPIREIESKTTRIRELFAPTLSGRFILNPSFEHTVMTQIVDIIARDTQMFQKVHYTEGEIQALLEQIRSAIAVAISRDRA